MIVQHKFTKDFVELPQEEQIGLIYLLGINAFKSISKENNNARITMLDDPDSIFEYCYLEIDVPHPNDDNLIVTLGEEDRPFFTTGWGLEQEQYFLGDEINKESKELIEKYNLGPKKIKTEDLHLSEEEKEVLYGKLVGDEESTKPLYPKVYGDSYYDYEDYDYGTPSGWKTTYVYKPYVYVEPTHTFDRFLIIKESLKKIIFPKDISDQLLKVFTMASGKEIMFYGELVQNEENPNLFTVTGMNFPPQKNFGGYVETADGKYEQWIFNEIIVKGKKVPLHVHTHPDFSAFSSSVDETQIKKYIEDNAGNPFVIQLIISNPRKGTYFARWFDLLDNTCEKPEVEFTYEKYDIEVEYPGIFQFTAPSYYSETYSGKYTYEPSSWWKDKTSGKAASKDEKHKSKVKKTYLEDTKTKHGKIKEEDEEDVDIFEKQRFDAYYAKKYGFKI